MEEDKRVISVPKNACKRGRNFGDVARSEIEFDTAGVYHLIFLAASLCKQHFQMCLYVSAETGSVKQGEMQKRRKSNSKQLDKC